MRFAVLAASAAVAVCSASASSSHHHSSSNVLRDTAADAHRIVRRSSVLAGVIGRDASTDMSKLGPANSEGEAHGKLDPPSGSELNSIPVGSGGEEIQTYFTKNADSAGATHAYVMIHGKLRDGDAYWTTMNKILQSAIKAKYAEVDDNAIIVAPQFFSTKLNSGQYTDNQLAWDDVNAWQAGDPANHPNSTKLTSFDALDALVAQFADTSKYPNIKNVTVVGHGGGGQLAQRYASVGQDAPSNIHVRYIHGDPSSCAYFTKDRPVSDLSVANKTDCPQYNTWRYGFDEFVGTSEGLKTPKEYFQRYISRDVVSVVGLQDVDASGDQYCMAQIQGGDKRRDRNLSWYRYINMLAGTNEDLTGFPGNFTSLPDWSNLSGRVINTRLVVIADADHSAEEVFSADEGRAALFSSATLPTGWRPEGWTQRPPFQADVSSASKSSSTSATAKASSQTGVTSPSAASSVRSTTSLVGAMVFVVVAAIATVV